MPQPERETARNLPTWDLVVEHDDMLFGGWKENKGNHEQPKRNRGILERLSAIEIVLKILGIGMVVLVAHAVGVPTEDILKGLMSVGAHMAFP